MMAALTTSHSSGIAPRSRINFAISFLWCSMATEMIGKPDCEVLPVKEEFKADQQGSRSLCLCYLR
jgi:hypothetical protein